MSGRISVSVGVRVRVRVNRLRARITVMAMSPVEVLDLYERMMQLSALQLQ